MELISTNISYEGEIYYLPHHGVVQESTTTTKLRVVFDGSAKSSFGISLNDKFMVGPKLQDDLDSILLRFRLHKVAFVADIAKMYRQITVDDSHRDYREFYGVTLLKNRFVTTDSQQLLMEPHRLHLLPHGVFSNLPWTSK